MKKPTAALLPFEVIQLIDSYLYDDERIECVSVCWNWYIIFKQLLYKNITISNLRKFDHLYRIINQGFNTVDDIGRHIKSIRFLPSSTFTAKDEDYRRFYKHFIKLPLICPNIANLNIPSLVLLWEQQQLLMEDKLTNMLLSFAPSLTDLTLAFAGESIPCMTGMDHLTTIDLAWADGVLELSTLENLHVECPKIKQLSLSVDHLSPLFEQELSELITVVSAKRLTHFSIESKQYFSTIEPIFRYASHKYPHLEHFGIKTLSPTSTMTDLEEEALEGDIGLSLLNRYSTYAAFVRNCQRLHTLVFRNILPHRVLLEAITTMGIQLRSIKVDTVFGMSRSLFDLIMRILQSSPRFSSITLYSSLRIRHTAEVLLASLHPCQILTHVKLGRLQTIYVDNILDQCLALKSLCLYDTMARVGAIGKTDACEHPVMHKNLRHFSIEKVIFDNHLYTYLSRRCPRLADLSIVNAVSSSQSSVCLYMPGLRLGNVRVSRIFTGAHYIRKLETQITTVILNSSHLTGKEITAIDYEQFDFIGDNTAEVYEAAVLVNHQRGDKALKTWNRPYGSIAFIAINPELSPMIVLSNNCGAVNRVYEKRGHSLLSNKLCSKSNPVKFSVEKYLSSFLQTTKRLTI
ncbi:MAG: hypothetical protein EXX96DRAFT_604762 [Benjaminiella poitrasii]|nr:MAG: hypothetical protein EXX96DRAFT_604762 [Benjaminiella poitrasii]